MGDMTRINTGNNTFLKKFNEKGILDLVRVNKSISRAELSQITGLSQTATGGITSSLVESGYIHETGMGESKGGRKPVMLELKPRSFFSAGFDIDVEHINAVLIDITGAIICEKSFRTDHAIMPDYVAKKIEVELTRMMQENGIESSRLIGIGISVPGMVDIHSQRIVIAPNLGWSDVDIANCLGMFSNQPVYIENEAMASAVCENWIGSCQQTGDFVCINIKSGIGAGIFVGGKLYRGAGGSAGEVGHIVVDENGPRCGCGNYGCLEAMASPLHVVERAVRLARQGLSPALKQLENIDDMTMDDVVHAARTGDEAALGVLMDSARYIGIAVAYLVNTLNPSKIVMGKEFVKYSDLVMDTVRSVVNSKALHAPARQVELLASSIGERSSTLGAAIIPLKSLFGR